MIHIVYPPGSGGHFFLSLLMGLDVENPVPPGNEYVNVKKDPRYGADREFCDGHEVRQVKKPFTRIVFYYRKKSTIRECLVLCVAKLANQTPPDLVDQNTIWCISKHSMAHNVKKYRQAYREAKQIGLPPCSTLTVRFCNTPDYVKTYKGFLEWDSLFLEERFDIDYANIPADYRYAVEDLLEGKVEGTLFEPYKEQVLRWIERNEVILRDYKYKMNNTQV